VNTSLKLSAYGAALAALVAGTYAIGTAVGPPTEANTGETNTAETTPAQAISAHAHEADGLASTHDGYTLVPQQPVLGSGTLAFRITGPDGVPVTAFDEVHEERLHLIVVRRDTTGFRHVHPEMDAAGTWRVPLTVDSGGAYRAFADFTPTGGPATTLGVDLFAAGPFEPVTHTESRTSTVDGYTVTLDGDLVAGATSPLRLTVTRDGAPVTDLQPYLGAAGHLVALRQGDLAYLHVHPEGHSDTTTSGPEIAFLADVPSAGSYRLFLDFQVGGVVRTAEFTATTAAPAVQPAAGHGHGH
jgi:hypothetical protein